MDSMTTSQGGTPSVLNYAPSLFNLCIEAIRGISNIMCSENVQDCIKKKLGDILCFALGGSVILGSGTACAVAIIREVKK